MPGTTVAHHMSCRRLALAVCLASRQSGITLTRLTLPIAATVTVRRVVGVACFFGLQNRGGLKSPCLFKGKERKQATKLDHRESCSEQKTKLLLKVMAS